MDSDRFHDRLGDREQALVFADRAVAATPASKDACCLS